MRKLICLLSLLLMSTFFVAAQDSLVKINGDSLVGKLNFAKDGLGVEYVTMKVGKKKQAVKLFEVRMIKTKKGDIIRPVEYNGTYKFGKQIVLDYLSYYKVSSDNTPEMFTDDLLTKMDGTALLLSGNIGFKGRVSKFLNDCYEVARAVKQKKYSRSKLKEIVADYNSCVEKNGLMSEDAIEQRAEQDRITKEKEKENAVSKSLEEKLADFSTLLEHSDKLSNKTDITAMFNDLSGKIRRNEGVPQYLKTALTEGVKSDPELKKLLSQIMSKIK